MTRGTRLRRIIYCIGSPGVQATVVLRYGQWLIGKPLIVKLLLLPIYWVFSFLMRALWGIEIPRSTKIGPELYIGHYGGIIISSATVIGRRAAISHQVTIGVSGRGEKRGTPVIGDNVYIGPGAKIFGKITIGNNVKIGANAVIHKDIPDNAVVVLDPGFKIISFKGNEPDDA
ncbi:serine acetyltransferase [bacterium]|nr:serine acetyltransferase [bacterium]